MTQVMEIASEILHAPSEYAEQTAKVLHKALTDWRTAAERQRASKASAELGEAQKNIIKEMQKEPPRIENERIDLPPAVIEHVENIPEIHDSVLPQISNVKTVRPNIYEKVIFDHPFYFENSNKCLHALQIVKYPLEASETVGSFESLPQLLEFLSSKSIIERKEFLKKLHAAGVRFAGEVHTPSSRIQPIEQIFREETNEAPTENYLEKFPELPTTQFIETEEQQQDQSHRISTTHHATFQFPKQTQWITSPAKKLAPFMEKAQKAREMVELLRARGSTNEQIEVAIRAAEQAEADFAAAFWTERDPKQVTEYKRLRHHYNSVKELEPSLHVRQQKSKNVKRPYVPRANMTEKEMEARSISSHISHDTSQDLAEEETNIEQNDTEIDPIPPSTTLSGTTLYIQFLNKLQTRESQSPSHSFESILLNPKGIRQYGKR
jgi:hypothetical protein